jgi:hypothetical protein
MKVIIVGTGFASTMAIIHLVKLGIKPIVIDVANKSDKDTKNLLKKDVFIKKNDYDNFLLLGGLSNVWTGVIDKFDSIDLNEWPIGFNSLNIYYDKLLKLVKEHQIYDFSIQKGNTLNNEIKNKINNQLLFKNKKTKIKSASLFLKKNKNNKYISLNFTNYINQQIKNSKIKFIKGKVEKISETNNGVNLEVNENKRVNYYKCDYLFIGCGSPSTLKLIQKSQRKYDDKLFLKNNKKIVYPVYFNQRKKILDPVKNFYNPYPLIQINHFSQKLGNIYSQVSNFNETLLSYILKNVNNLKLLYKLLKIFHKFGFAYTSLDSKYGDKFTFDVNDNIIVQKSKYDKKFFKENMSTFTENNSVNDYFKFINLPIFRNELSGNHFGSVFPMRKSKKKFYESDIYGRICNYKKISILDSSIFTTLPSKPPTFTIMANALRIVDNVTKKIFD